MQAARSSVLVTPLASPALLRFRLTILFLSLVLPGAKAARGDAAPNGARQPEETEDGQWLRPAKNFASTRYSQLDQIRGDNVKDLRVTWTFSTGVDRGQEAAPIVVGSTMYVATPFPNVLYALDVGNQGALKWKYDPKPAPAAQGVACCDVVTRGAISAGDRIVFNTLDGNTIAVSADSGEELWNTKVGEINLGET